MKKNYKPNNKLNNSLGVCDIDKKKKKKNLYNFQGFYR